MHLLKQRFPGDLKLTQSLTILRHLARKHRLDGESEAERARIELVEQQANDMRWNLVRVCYNFVPPDYETKRNNYLESLPTQLALLEVNFIFQNYPT